MSLMVQKYGGTSVATPDLIKRVARRVIDTRKKGRDVVVVVSAMGDTTDALETLAHKVSSNPMDREMDMLMISGERISMALLAMAINDMGQEAISFTGSQSGIITDTVHRKARIIDIKPDRLFEELDKGKILIVAGYQGVTMDAQETALGRGGSDLTAVALAYALKADQCEIYTDVDGVYTADPRVVPEAKKLDLVSHDEMLELASLGAGVMQARSVEFAKKFGVVIHVRSSFDERPGTVIKEEDEMMEKVLVRGIAHDTNEAKVTVRHVLDRPGIAAAVFGSLADANINVDMIIQNVSERNFTDISFTVAESELKRAIEVCEALKEKIEARDVTSDDEVAKVSVVGVGMKSHSGIAATMFKALAEAGVNIEMISTSEIKISCVVRESDAEKAVQVLHRAFELDKETVVQTG